MEVLIFCGIYLVELVCYQLGLRILFEVRQKTHIFMAAGVLFPIVIGLLPIDNTVEKTAYITISVLCVTSLSMDGKVMEKGVRMIFTLILLECITASFFYSSRELFLGADLSRVKNLDSLVLKLCTCASLFLLKLIKDKIDRDKVHISLLIYLTIGLITAFMIFCLEFFEQLMEDITDSKILFFSSALNVAILVNILCLMLFVAYIKNTHEKMEYLLKMEQILKESQVNYYKQMLKREADTRQYRHDVVSHLIYLQDTLEKNKIEQTKNYLNHMLGGIKKIQRAHYVTGNEMVDTIMNYFFGMLPQSAKIIITGKCPLELAMEETDICTVFANVFQNIVDEATENQEKAPQILVEIQKGQKYAEYKITNSLGAKGKEIEINKNGLPKSHKADQRNHGIGMANVKQTVERNGGKFDWSQTDNCFCVSLILPIQ